MKKYKLIFQDNNYIIVNKPAGLIVHGNKNIKDISLADQLLNDFPEIKKVGENPFRPGIVHRLDKPVSGIMIIARNNKSFDFLKKIFKNRKVKKNYLALVYGEIIPDEGEINFVIKRASKGYKMVALPATIKKKPNTEGRQSISEFRVIKRFFHYTLLSVTIKTGRTHQIRAHFAAYGNPLVGDDLYGNKKTKEKNKKMNLQRIWLHAQYLSFLDMDNKKREFFAPLDIELKKFLHNLKTKPFSKK